ncbi:MAG: ATP-binding protein [Deltaproteobacteria bacterium]|nr:ATP-binding protein [Deltaproteobacteria bacterium]
MFKREAEASVTKHSKTFPIVAVTGPRQAGKTTLVQSLFKRKPYVSLEDLDQRNFAQRDPRGFLGRYDEGVILDEAQRCPDLFSYLQSFVDARKKMGLVVLTGSQHFALLSGISQSLAGRVALTELLPFSLQELQNAKQAPSNIEALLFQGLYPPLYDRHADPETWYANYVSTYIERDVRQLLNVQDLRAFHLFLRMCAARTGQILNLSSLANDCGITHNTAKAWISVLEASYIIFLLPPHHRNFSKRLIKSPKLYFYDSGLAAHLNGLQEARQLTTHIMRGPLFETWVVSELIKHRFNQGRRSNLYFWRDVQGHEIDVLIERGDELIPVEIKSGKTISDDYFTSLRSWSSISGQSLGAGFLIYAGDQSQKRSQGTVLGWEDVGKIVAS